MTEQEEVVVAPTCASVHVVPGLENAPEAAGAAPNVTEPVGNDFVPASVSETVAVHVEPCPKATEDGEQSTSVDVDRSVTVSAKPSVSALAE